MIVSSRQAGKGGWTVREGEKMEGAEIRKVVRSRLGRTVQMEVRA